jgi:dipeptidase E
MSETRILLGGGGSAEDERPIFERFAAWVGASGAVLYLPIASTHAGEVYLNWISAALNPLDVRHIDMWTSLTGHAPVALDSYAALFIGGGNTYYLLHQLRISGLDQAIRDFARRDGVVYGGSAGAIVMGQDISPCAHLDENTVGLGDTSGLDLLHGDSVWCHYQQKHDARIRAYVERTHSASIALAETSGVWVRGPQMYTPLGSGSIYCFTGVVKHKV